MARAYRLRSSKRYGIVLKEKKAMHDRALKRVSEKDMDRLLSGKSSAVTLPPPPSAKELRELFAEADAAENVWRAKLAKIAKFRS